MGTIKADPEEPETRTHIVARNFRLAVAGDTRASVRRILLYVIAGASMGLALAHTTSPMLVVALVALMLLALTDQLV